MCAQRNISSLHPAENLDLVIFILFCAHCIRPFFALWIPSWIPSRLYTLGTKFNATSSCTLNAISTWFQGIKVPQSFVCALDTILEYLPVFTLWEPSQMPPRLCTINTVPKQKQALDIASSWCGFRYLLIFLPPSWISPHLCTFWMPFHIPSHILNFGYFLCTLGTILYL